jgi:DNA modification methylase
MTPHLEYHWAIACHMPGEAAEMWHRKVRCTWKPFLWFTKGSYEGKWVNDVARSDAPEKGLHPWQQSESLFEGLIEQVTEPGQLILDTFFGSGTVGAVAMRMNRRFIGIDIDAAAIDTAEERLLELGKKIVWPSFCSNPGPEPGETGGKEEATQ